MTASYGLRIKPSIRAATRSFSTNVNRFALPKYSVPVFN
jgi:hypothetical protein